MKVQKFLLTTITFLSFIFLQNSSFAQVSASCPNPSGFTANAGNSSLTISGGTAIKVELEKQDYSWIKICDNNDNNYPNCSGVISVTPEVYRTVKFFDSNWTPCETTTGIEITSGGSGTIDCNIAAITNKSSDHCNNMGTTDPSDDVFNPSFVPNNNTPGNFYYVELNGTIIQTNIPYGTPFVDPTAYPIGTTNAYRYKNTSSTCTSIATIASGGLSSPSACSDCVDNNNNGICDDAESSGSSCQQWEGDCNTSGNISRTGKVTIGRLDVTDIIHSKKVYVHLPSDFPVPDYVFENDYDLMPLNRLEKYINENKHLPNIPSAEEVHAKGIDVTDLQMKQLEKIEELTLHLIELSKKVEHLEKDNKKLQKKRFFRKRK